MKRIVIACDDLFGLEIKSIIDEINKWHQINRNERRYDLIGFLSDKDDPFGENGVNSKVIGKISEWTPEESIGVVMGIKYPEEKAAAVQLLRSRGARFETIVAPWMLSYPEWLTIGEGCIVCPYSAKPGMVIGDFVTIEASMLSGYKIGDYSTVMRFANIAGEGIGAYSYVGDHVFLAVGKKIGDHCTVANGSIVVKNAKDHTSVAGIPARRIQDVNLM